MKIYEVIVEGPPNITPATDPYAEKGRPGGKNTPKKSKGPELTAGQKPAFNNYMQRGQTLSRQRMTSKQYGAGRVGLT